VNRVKFAVELCYETTNITSNAMRNNRVVTVYPAEEAISNYAALSILELNSTLNERKESSHNFNCPNKVQTKEYDGDKSISNIA